MELRIIGDTTDSLEVSDGNFAVDFNKGLVHQVVTSYLAGGRAGTKAQKTRSEVRGGGAKPWKQKGTGRARAGTICSPIWRTGGVTFAAKPRSYTQKVNRKTFKLAIKCILSELVREEKLIVVDEILAETRKTKDFIRYVNETFDVENALIVTTEMTENLYYASRNLIGIEVADVASINPVLLLQFKKVILTASAVKEIEAWLA